MNEGATACSNFFAYGSLMFPTIWEAVVSKSGWQFCNSYIAGYRRVKIVDECYPALIKAPAQFRVRGVVYQELNREDWRQLDAFEGGAYYRERVRVTLDGGNKLFADTYLFSPLSTHLLTSDDWEPSQFQRQCIDYFKDISMY